MRRIIGWSTAIGIGFWSLFAWIAYSVVDIFGTGASSVGAVPGFPADRFSFAWIAGQLHGLGLSMVFIIWLTGVAIVLAVAALVRRLFGVRREALPSRQSWGSSIPSGSFHDRPRPGVLQRLFGR